MNQNSKSLNNRRWQGLFYWNRIWSCRNDHLVFSILAFAIPLIVRAIPEVLMGEFLVGFDSMGYYVPNTLNSLGNDANFWALMSSAPLLYLILIGSTSLGASIVITLKVLGPLLLGLLGLLTYYYAKRALSWSYKKSLTVAILSALYFVALRISWDMFRSELALIFLFAVLIFLQKKEFSIRNGLFLSVAMFLVVFSHQLIAIVMFAIIIAVMANLLLKNRRNQLQGIIICLIPALVLLLSIIYINYYVHSSPIFGYSINYSGGLEELATISHLNLIYDTLGFLLFCYLPLIPLVVFGIKKLKSNIQLNAWIIWLFVPLIIVIASPNSFFIGGVLPYRWILLLTYPLSFYAVEGIFSIKWNWYKIGYKIAIGYMIAFLSVGFLVLPNSGALSYFGSYPTYVPKSMLQNTLQLRDCQDTVNALSWAKENMASNGSLLVHEAFYGWATLNLNSNQFVPYFFGNLTEAVHNIQKNSTIPLYSIWWINGLGWYGQPSMPSGFIELYRSGNIAIYQYIKSE